MATKNGLAFESDSVANAVTNTRKKKELCALVWRGDIVVTAAMTKTDKSCRGYVSPAKIGQPTQSTTFESSPLVFGAF